MGADNSVNKRPPSPSSSSPKGSPSKKHKVEKQERGVPPHPDQESKVAADKIKITYYNVGQGNCVLMENQTKKQAVLVDCGSTETREENRKDLGKPIIIKENIQDNIAEELGKYPDSSVSIIVTHLDIDHYNWIQPIMEKYNKKNEGKKVNFIISSKTRIGKKKEKNFLEWIDAMEAQKNTVAHIENRKELEDNLIKLNLRSWIDPLTAGAGGEKKEDEGSAKAQETANENSKNADSVVINVRSGKHCSALLTGDATDASAHQIEKEGQNPHLKTTVLLASHHGAHTFGSNSNEWIKKASPQAVIISAGLFAHHGHPRCTVLQRYLDPAVAKIQRGTEHNLTCFMGYVDLGTLESLQEVITSPHKFWGSEAIYNTYDQGDITLQFEDDHFTIVADKKGESVPMLEKKPCIVH
jgi:beta-lactamase superfamily II metal-dependent hydrolase